MRTHARSHNGTKEKALKRYWVHFSPATPITISLNLDLSCNDCKLSSNPQPVRTQNRPSAKASTASLDPMFLRVNMAR